MNRQMQQLARDELVMAKSKRVIRDMKYRYADRPDGASRLSRLLSRHFDVYVNAHIIEDIWADMADHTAGSSNNGQPERQRPLSV